MRGSVKSGRLLTFQPYEDGNTLWCDRFEHTNHITMHEVPRGYISSMFPSNIEEMFLRH